MFAARLDHLLAGAVVDDERHRGHRLGGDLHPLPVGRRQHLRRDRLDPVDRWSAVRRSRRRCPCSCRPCCPDVLEPLDPVEALAPLDAAGGSIAVTRRGRRAAAAQHAGAQLIAATRRPRLDCRSLDQTSCLHPRLVGRRALRPEPLGVPGRRMTSVYSTQANSTNSGPALGSVAPPWKIPPNPWPNTQ